MTATIGVVTNPRKRTASKLAPEIVAEIKERLRNETTIELAYQFGVSRLTVSDIKHGRTWLEIQPAMRDHRVDPRVEIHIEEVK